MTTAVSAPAMPARPPAVQTGEPWSGGRKVAAGAAIGTFVATSLGAPFLLFSHNRGMQVAGAALYLAGAGAGAAGGVLAGEHPRPRPQMQAAGAMIGGVAGAIAGAAIGWAPLFGDVPSNKWAAGIALATMVGGTALGAEIAGNAHRVGEED